ncbi:unnamed protein product [Rodentolepis nana]|uniref:Secreted protein n=1 Tax=Rodentolepis nana TaxID=102285 RepID=A0A0R3TDI3_RODNA|nr:unnamed protein product [Rodentolepis nana]
MDRANGLSWTMTMLRFLRIVSFLCTAKAVKAAHFGANYSTFELRYTEHWQVVECQGTPRM